VAEGFGRLIGGVKAELGYGPALPKPTEEEKREALQRAEEIRRTVGKRYNVSPYLAGSLATGLNIPGQHDFDYGVRVTSKPKFDKLVNRLQRAEGVKTSPYNQTGTDYHVFTTSVGGEPVDLAVMYGDKGKLQRQAIQRAQNLSQDEKDKIIAEKARLSNVLFFQKQRKKRFKRQVDAQLGLPRFGKEKVGRVVTDQEWRRLATRPTVFGHRTNNIEPIMQSQRLLSAADAAKRGALKSYETGTGRGSRERSDLSERRGERKMLRSEVFMNKGGLMPPSEAYGQYGVLFEKQKAAPSKYLNAVPREHTAETVKSKLTYVVPDKEFAKWNRKFPDRKIMRESHVPEHMRLPGKDRGELIQRILTGPKLYEKKEEVKIGGALAKKKGLRRVGQLLSGSRMKALEERAAGLESPFRRRAQRALEPVRSSGMKKRRIEESLGRVKSRGRVESALKAEQEAVQKARKTTKTVGGVAAGLGAAALGAGAFSKAMKEPDYAAIAAEQRAKA